jgi:hypothetical protein
MCGDNLETFKEIVLESIDRFFPHKVLRKSHDPESYNKEVKRLKLKVREVYKRKLGYRYHVELKRLSKELLAAKKLHRKHICRQHYEMKANDVPSSTRL